MEVVEHVPDVQQLLSECIKRLKPGGHLFVATINRTLASFVTAIVGAEYVFRMLPREHSKDVLSADYGCDERGKCPIDGCYKQVTSWL